jgi:heptose-I-phosphate ethanolaminephosphotransferase
LNTRLLYSYLFFIFVTGAAQIYLSFFHYSNFEALKDIVAISLLWTLPVIIFPNRAKKITLYMGIPFVLLALPSVFYAIIYKQELTQSLFFIIFESNIAESKEYLQNYFSLSVFVLITFYSNCLFLFLEGVKNFEISNKTKLILAAIILTLVFTAPTKRWIKRGIF